jgi:hypothetical protein
LSWWAIEVQGRQAQGKEIRLKKIRAKRAVAGKMNRRQDNTVADRESQGEEDRHGSEMHTGAELCQRN